MIINIMLSACSENLTGHYKNDVYAFTLQLNWCAGYFDYTAGATSFLLRHTITIHPAGGQQ